MVRIPKRISTINLIQRPDHPISTMEQHRSNIYAQSMKIHNEHYAYLQWLMT
ncbi:MAG: hypothetical protein OJF50_005176 [Nitrospira sp.]|nr:hypothetical protein [Nitrospira sp.]